MTAPWCIVLDQPRLAILQAGLIRLGIQYDNLPIWIGNNSELVRFGDDVRAQISNASPAVVIIDGLSCIEATGILDFILAQSKNQVYNGPTMLAKPVLTASS